jgi:hypothetical protein
VAVGTLVPPNPSNPTEFDVAVASSGAGDQWDWLYLLDLGTNTRYQLYWESNSSGKVYTYFGYYNPSSSEGNSNPSAFPPNFSFTSSEDDPVYKLLATPPPAAQTDVMALFDNLAYVLVGNNFVYSQSTTYDTQAYPELAPFISKQMTLSSGPIIFDDLSTAQSVVVATYPSIGTYSNPPQPTAQQIWGRSLLTSITLTLSEALSISESFSVTGGVPGFGNATSTFSLSLTTTTTQAQTSTDTVDWSFDLTITIPAGQTVKWTFTVQELNLTIGFTAQVLMQGSVAIRSKQDLNSTQKEGITGVVSQKISGSTDYLIIAPVGALWNYLYTQSNNTLPLKFSYQSPNAVN